MRNLVKRIVLGMLRALLEASGDAVAHTDGGWQRTDWCLFADVPTDAIVRAPMAPCEGVLAGYNPFLRLPRDATDVFTVIDAHG